NDRLGAGLDSNLIKPCIARFGQRLDEIQRAAIALFPIVESDIANLNCRDAIKSIIWTHRGAFERGDADRNFKRRSWRIRRTIGAWQQWKLQAVLQHCT